MIKYYLKPLFFLFFFFIVTTTSVWCKENVVYIDLDSVIGNSNYGKTILNDIKDLNNKNIKKLKSMEKELKTFENKLNSKKNIISESQFNKELDLLKDKIKIYQEQKNKMIVDFEEKKTKNLNDFFIKINPIIQKYMDENSIDILLKKENIFIGKSNLDISEIIIKKINLKYN